MGRADSIPGDLDNGRYQPREEIGRGGRIALYSDRNSLANDHVAAAGGASFISGQPGTITNAPFGRGLTNIRAASNAEAALDRR